MAALAARLPDSDVVEACVGAPDVVVAVVSAVAPVTRSDWAVVERAAPWAVPVIGVVSKVDAHHGWRDVLAADRTLVASWGAQYRSTPWVGVAGAPGLGAPRIDELVDLLGDVLDRKALPKTSIRYGTVRRGPDPAESRRVLQHSRLRLLRLVRDGSAAVRAELREAAARVGPRGSAGFEALVAAETRRFHLRLTDEVDRTVAATAAELGTTAAPGPPTHGPPDTSRTATPSRPLEGRLAAVLGVGLGLGIALACSRLLAGVMPEWSVAGWFVGMAAGLAVVGWVVRARGLLHERALLDRWVVEVAAALRWHGEAMVAERLLAAESEWATGPRQGSRNGLSTSRQLTGDDVTDQYEWC